MLTAYALVVAIIILFASTIARAATPIAPACPSSWMLVILGTMVGASLGVTVAGWFANGGRDD